MVARALCVALLGVALCLGPADSRAQDVVVRAAVDRASLRENESFTYTLRAEGQVRGEPDITVLEQDFDVINRSSSKRVQILNGQLEQVAEWQFQLMPTATGRFELPPVSVGGALSNALELNVLAAPPPGVAVADIFMEVEAVPDSAYVQSQVIFTLRLFVGVGTGRATLTAPEIGGGEAIVERLGEDTQFQTVRDGREFVVRERRYAIFPQDTGVLTVGPATFEAMVIPNRGFSRVQRFRSGAVEVEVMPAVAPPPEYPNAIWLPASSVTLGERWSDNVREFELGIPRTRTLTIEGEGLLKTQLPELELRPADGIRQYPDQPDLDSVAQSSGLTAQRVERFAVMAQRAGVVELPGVELPWWDVNAERWEVARLEPRTVTVLPSGESVVQPDIPQPASTPPPPATPPDSGIWRYLSAALGVGWLITALLWWRSAHPVAGRTRKPRVHPRWRANRRLVTELRAACAKNDALEAQGILMQWAKLRFAEDPPNSLGALAEQLPETLATAINELEISLYGQAGQEWAGGQALRGAFDALEAVTQSGRNKRSDALMPLYR